MQSPPAPHSQTPLYLCPTLETRNEVLHPYRNKEKNIIAMYFNILCKTSPMEIRPKSSVYNDSVSVFVSVPTLLEKKKKQFQGL
jgi:hypothetical protein